MNVRALILKLVPWLITSLIVGYISLTTDVTVAWETLRNANFLGFVPTVIAVAAGVFLVDSGCLVALFRRFNAPVTYREVLPIKGASYFLNVINYNAAAAAIGLFFRNRKRVPLLESLGSMLWLNFLDIVSLTTLMMIGIVVAGDLLEPKLLRLLLISAGAIYLILIGSCIYWIGGFDFFFMGRFRTWQIFSTFRRATLRDYGIFLAMRIGFSASYILSQLVSMPFFDMHPTLQELVLYVPVITFVGTIPLTTIAGLGTVQVLMRHFYLGFAPHGTAQIDAYSTTSILAFVLVRILIGYFYMGSVARDFGSGGGSSADTESDT